MLINTSKSYGWVSILLHWAMALAFIAMFAVGIYMVELDYYDSWYHRAPELHKSTGILLVFLMLFRFVWNQSQPRPADLSSHKMTNRLAHLGHYSFYFLVLCLFISGYLISTAKGKGIEVFNLFSIPSLLVEDSERGDLGGVIHKILAFGFMGLAVVHAMAALYHHFIIKDFTLQRMLGIFNQNKGDT